MIRLSHSQFDDNDLEAIAACLRSGLLAQGKLSENFGEQVAEVAGCTFGLSTSSCTSALHLSLEALSLDRGAKVAIPAFTFPATANAVIQAGLIPQFIDIDASTYAMSIHDLRARADADTAAVIVVHPFGSCADMDPILEFTGQRGLPVVEDAACAIGSNYKGRPAGSLGSVACFSFHQRKVVSIGEGGALTTNSSTIHERAALLRSHGAQRQELYSSFLEPGYNYRMSDLAASLGISQLARLDDLINSRRRMAQVYVEKLGGLGWLALPEASVNSLDTYQSFVVRLDSSVDRDDVIRQLRHAGIETTLGWYSLPNEPAFRSPGQAHPSEFQEAADAAKHSLALPIHSRMDDEQISYIVDCLRALRLSAY